MDLNTKDLSAGELITEVRRETNDYRIRVDYSGEPINKIYVFRGPHAEEVHAGPSPWNRPDDPDYPRYFIVDDDEELVFLVTDAFGLQQAARKDVDNGDLGAAATKLREANAKLNEAAERITAIQEQEADDGIGFAWVLVFMTMIVGAGLVYYLVSSPEEE